jgi:hypothetical protein
VVRPGACGETPSAAPTSQNSRLRHAPDSYTASWRPEPPPAEPHQNRYASTSRVSSPLTNSGPGPGSRGCRGGKPEPGPPRRRRHGVLTAGGRSKGTRSVRRQRGIKDRTEVAGDITGAEGRAGPTGSARRPPSWVRPARGVARGVSTPREDPGESPDRRCCARPALRARRQRPDPAATARRVAPHPGNAQSATVERGMTHRTLALGSHSAGVPVPRYALRSVFRAVTP